MAKILYLVRSTPTNAQVFSSKQLVCARLDPFSKMPSLAVANSSGELTYLTLEPSAQPRASFQLHVALESQSQSIPKQPLTRAWNTFEFTLSRPGELLLSQEKSNKIMFVCLPVGDSVEEQVLFFGAHPGDVRCMARTSDFLVSGCSEGCLQAWILEDGRVMGRQLEAHGAGVPITAVAILSDNMAASGSAAGDVLLWHMDDAGLIPMQRLATAAPAAGPITALATGPPSPYSQPQPTNVWQLAVLGGELQVWTWEGHAKAAWQLQAAMEHPHLHCCSFLPGLQTLVVGAGDLGSGWLLLYDSSTLSTLQQWSFPYPPLFVHLLSPPSGHPASNLDHVHTLNHVSVTCSHGLPEVITGIEGRFAGAVPGGPATPPQPEEQHTLPFSANPSDTTHGIASRRDLGAIQGVCMNAMVTEGRDHTYLMEARVGRIDMQQADNEPHRLAGAEVMTVQHEDEGVVSDRAYVLSHPSTPPMHTQPGLHTPFAYADPTGRGAGPSSAMIHLEQALQQQRSNHSMHSTHSTHSTPFSRPASSASSRGEYRERGVVLAPPSSHSSSGRASYHGQDHTSSLDICTTGPVPHSYSRQSETLGYMDPIDAEPGVGPHAYSRQSDTTGRMNPIHTEAGVIPHAYNRPLDMAGHMNAHSIGTGDPRLASHLSWNHPLPSGPSRRESGNMSPLLHGDNPHGHHTTYPVRYPLSHQNPSDPNLLRKQMSEPSHARSQIIHTHSMESYDEAVHRARTPPASMPHQRDAVTKQYSTPIWSPFANHSIEEGANNIRGSRSSLPSPASSVIPPWATSDEAVHPSPVRVSGTRRRGSQLDGSYGTVPPYATTDPEPITRQSTSYQQMFTHPASRPGSSSAAGQPFSADHRDEGFDQQNQASSQPLDHPNPRTHPAPSRPASLSPSQIHSMDEVDLQLSGSAGQHTSTHPSYPGSTPTLQNTQSAMLQNPHSPSHYEAGIPQPGSSPLPHRAAPRSTWSTPVGHHEHSRPQPADLHPSSSPAYAWLNEPHLNPSSDASCLELAPGDDEGALPSNSTFVTQTNELVPIPGQPPTLNPTQQALLLTQTSAPRNTAQQVQRYHSDRESQSSYHTGRMSPVPMLLLPAAEAAGGGSAVARWVGDASAAPISGKSASSLGSELALEADSTLMHFTPRPDATPRPDEPPPKALTPTIPGLSYPHPQFLRKPTHDDSRHQQQSIAPSGVAGLPTAHLPRINTVNPGVDDPVAASDPVGRATIPTAQGAYGSASGADRFPPLPTFPVLHSAPDLRDTNAVNNFSPQGMPHHNGPSSDADRSVQRTFVDDSIFDDPSVSATTLSIHPQPHDPAHVDIDASDVSNVVPGSCSNLVVLPLPVMDPGADLVDSGANNTVASISSSSSGMSNQTSPWHIIRQQSTQDAVPPQPLKPSSMSNTDSRGVSFSLAPFEALNSETASFNAQPSSLTGKTPKTMPSFRSWAITQLLSSQANRKSLGNLVGSFDSPVRDYLSEGLSSLGIGPAAESRQGPKGNTLAAHGRQEIYGRQEKGEGEGTGGDEKVHGRQEKGEREGTGGDGGVERLQAGNKETADQLQKAIEEAYDLLMVGTGGALMSLEEDDDLPLPRQLPSHLTKRTSSSAHPSSGFPQPQAPSVPSHPSNPSQPPQPHTWPASRSTNTHPSRSVSEALPTQSRHPTSPTFESASQHRNESPHSRPTASPTNESSFKGTSPADMLEAAIRDARSQLQEAAEELSATSIPPAEYVFWHASQDSAQGTQRSDAGAGGASPRAIAACSSLDNLKQARHKQAGMRLQAGDAGQNMQSRPSTIHLGREDYGGGGQAEWGQDPMLEHVGDVTRHMQGLQLRQEYDDPTSWQARSPTREMQDLEHEDVHVTQQMQDMSLEHKYGSESSRQLRPTAWEVQGGRDDVSGRGAQPSDPREQSWRDGNDLGHMQTRATRPQPQPQPLVLRHLPAPPGTTPLPSTLHPAPGAVPQQAHARRGGPNPPRNPPSLQQQDTSRAPDQERAVSRQWTPDRFRNAGVQPKSPVCSSQKGGRDQDVMRPKPPLVQPAWAERVDDSDEEDIDIYHEMAAWKAGRAAAQQQNLDQDDRVEGSVDERSTAQDAGMRSGVPFSSQLLARKIERVDSQRAAPADPEQVRQLAAKMANLNIPRGVSKYKDLQPLEEEEGEGAIVRQLPKQLHPAWVANRKLKPDLNQLWNPEDYIQEVCDTSPYLLPLPDLTLDDTAQDMLRLYP